MRALVTGASGGLGAETARALAERGARVTLTARDVAKGAQGRRGDPQVDRQRSRRRDAARARRSRAACASSRAPSWRASPSLTALINNAGVMACPLARTAQGYEMQFATNHLGHFLLTCLLAPALRRGAPARVVSVSSRGHRFSPVVFEDIHFERRPYDKWASLRPVEDRERALRRRARPAPARRRRARQRAPPGRDRHGARPSPGAAPTSRSCSRARRAGSMEWKTVPSRRRHLDVGGHRARARGSRRRSTSRTARSRAAQLRPTTRAATRRGRSTRRPPSGCGACRRRWSASASRWPSRGALRAAC